MIEDLFGYPPFSLKAAQKKPLFLEALTAVTQHHIANCPEYSKFAKAFCDPSNLTAVEDFPFLPVTVFKTNKLTSVNESAVIKILKSSGTTGQTPSAIYLDKLTSERQTKALAHIVQDFIGKERLPTIFVDTKAVFKDKESFSARGAGVLGFATFGKNHFYLLDEDMNMDIEGLLEFAEKYKNEPNLIFGFTYLVWLYLYKELTAKNIKLDLSNAILVHSGGWKKLIEQSVDNGTFKAHLKEQLSIKHVYNFYGMAEQVGSVFMECEEGNFHTSVFSDILIRDPANWQILPHGTQGIIEILSVLPHSYPGHILLTEDFGTIMGEDTCPCGRYGKYFRVAGRIPKAELRGCSDTAAV